MEQDTIAEVGIDEHKRLCQTLKLTFPFVWRAAMEVYWDDERGRLFSPKPREWTYVNWFTQIVWAVADEYETWLQLTCETTRSNVSDHLRLQMIAAPLPPIASRNQ
jgi:hypothetical protein